VRISKSRSRTSATLPHALPTPAHRPALGGLVGDESGQAMVEFAIVATVLLLIITGILYFGRYLSFDENLTQLASEGARFAAVGDTSLGGGLDAYIQQHADPGVFPNGSPPPQQVWVYPNGGGTSATIGQPITACVTSTYQPLPFLNIGTITVTRYATMVAEMSFTTPDSDSSIPSGCPA
jgi:Flp pilus assembly pilin Flp